MGLAGAWGVGSLGWCDKKCEYGSDVACFVARASTTFSKVTFEMQVQIQGRAASFPARASSARPRLAARLPLTRTRAAGQNDDGSTLPEDDSWNTALGSLSLRIEQMKMSSTTRFLLHGYHAGVLEARAQELLDCRPELPDPSVAPSSWQEHVRDRERVFDWHENAWEKLRQAADE